MSKNNLEIITLKKPGITDFAMERNLLLKNAESRWVFFLDSDEKMSAGLKKEITEVISTPGVGHPHFSGFYVKRKNYFLGQYVGTDNILRLGKKNSGKWERKVHETWNIKGKTDQLNNPIIHNTAKNLHEFIGKINFYSTLHAEENLKAGKRSNLFKIIFYPPAKFFQSLLDGRGFVMSMLQSFHSFLSWSKLWILQKK